MPLAPTAEQIAEIDASMPVLPAARRARLGELSTVADEVLVTVVERGQDALALGAIEAGADADKVLTRIQNDLAVDDWSAVTSESLATLIQMESGGELTATQAKQVLGEMAEGRPRRRPEGDRCCERLRGDGERRARDAGRSADRGQPRRMVAVLGWRRW